MKEVLLYLKTILESNDKIVVATSGGPDSMCLLHLLCELKTELNLKLVVAHVNHNLRLASQEEALFVKDYCQKQEIVYEYMEIQEYNKDNLENDARIKRYTFFKQLMQKYHAKYLMTAHHGDDLMETILMRLTRGSSLKGYSGFKREYSLDDYTIIRPLIIVTKQEIISYMQKHKLKYYIDDSNFADTYTRNRYRKVVLPFLKQEDKNVHQKYLKFSEELQAATNFIEKEVTKKISELTDQAGIRIDELLKLDDFILKRVVEHTLNNIYIDDLFLINDRHTELIIKMLKSTKSNAQISLPDDYVALKSYNYYKIVKINKEENYEYILESKVVLPNNMVIKRCKENNGTSNFVLRLNSQDISLPLKVRSRLPGDKIAVKNLGGSKKVKDIYIDEKISKINRDNIPIVTDNKGTILWLPGIKKSKFDVETDGIYDIILSYEEE